MKKIISLFLCINFFNINCAFAIVDVFEDTLLNLLDKNLKIQKPAQEIVIDELALKTLNPSLKIKKQETNFIEDDLTKSNLNPNLKITKIKTPIFEDETSKLLIGKEIKKNIKDNKVSFFNENYTKIKIRPQKYYTTRKNLFEGDYINFTLAQDTKIKNKLYKEGTSIKARVENVSQNGAYGIPADVVIGNFILNDEIKLDGEISKTGANRSLWVYPVGYTLTLFLGIGIFLYPIRGGHAKFKTSKIYEFETFE